jgi:hypothetical protein
MTLPDATMTDYLDEFDELNYEFVDDGDSIELTNLKAMNGMDVAELLTYLHDDGYHRFGPMMADVDNGSLTMVLMRND